MSVDSGADVNDAPQTDSFAVTDDALGAVWDKLERDNGADRGADGKFTSSRAEASTVEDTKPAGGAEPLEGGEGGEAAADEGSTAPAAVPLPANMRGLEDVWGKIPADLQKPIADHQTKLHKTLSEQGQALASWKPVRDTIEEFKEYFGGERGNHDPAQAIRALFETVRGLDDNPVETWLQVAKEYNILDKVASAFQLSGDPDQTNTQNAALLAEIGELKRTIYDLKTGFRPEVIDERVSRRLDEERTLTTLTDLISRASKNMPLYNDVEPELPGYIAKAWQKLGSTASQDAVLERAYDMAVHADPDLRARAAALKGAAVNDAGKVAAQKAANAANLKSTSTGKPRELSEDELLGGIFDKYAKG